MEYLTVTIDGKTVSTAPGQTVLEAALGANIYIPNLCTHPALPVQAGCKLCVVEIDGKTMQACETPVTEGMRVLTKTEDITRRRNLAMELMLAGHPQDCTSCKVYLKCELQALMQYMGTVHSRLRTVQRETNKIGIESPLILREVERCVQCGRCVRACNDLRGVGTLQYQKQGGETYIGTEQGAGLPESGCRFCGACVEVCPTGALQDKEGLFSPNLTKYESLVPCEAECPAKINIPEYVRLVSEGKNTEAHGVIREKVPFPHTLGYICNNRCEDGCKRGQLNSPVSIRNLKRYAVEHDADRNWTEKAIAPLAPKSGKKVAIVGGGPCGLTAALYLQKKGHTVTVYERLPLVGGQLVTGIPAYRLPLADVQREVDIIMSSGVTIKTDSNISDAASLKKDYDAVLVAIGAAEGKKLPIKGAELVDTHTALDVLRDIRLDIPVQIGERVNIIGGGNVAFDCARTLLRMGKQVNLICLEKGEAIPADEEELTEAAEEGAVLYEGSVTVEIESESGKIIGQRIVAVTNFYLDENKKPVIETDPSSERMIPCDSIIFAVGQGTDLTPEFGIELNRFGYPLSEDGSTTSIPGIFAAGDVMTGTRFVIEAIQAGREAAKTIDQYLGGDGNIDETLVARPPKKPQIGKIESFAELERVPLTVKDVEVRKSSFVPVTNGLTCDEATLESSRCLQCDLRRDIGTVKLWTEYTAK